MTIARTLTNTFSGIRPIDRAGLHRRASGSARSAALALMNWLLREPPSPAEALPEEAHL